MKKSKIKLLSDDRGSLFSFERKGFLIKRIFFIQGLKNKIRGNHAHKKTNQIIININSNVKIEASNKRKIKINLSKKGDVFFCPKKTWLKIKFIKTGFLAVICDQKYKRSDYINKITDFKKLYS
jgi:hypothetical protein